MKLTFLGTRGFVDEKSRKHKNRSSLLVETKKTKLLIDFGDEYEPEILDKIKPDAILITHWHPDHAFGLKKVKELKIPIYITTASLNSDYYKEEDFQHLEKNYKKYKRRGVISIGDIKIHSVPVLHSVKAPNVALFIEAEGKRICYASDVVSIRKSDREKLLRGCILYIGDLSTHQKKGLIRIAKNTKTPIGHASPHTQIRWCEDASVPFVYFTHLGSEPIKKGREYLKENLSKISEKVTVEIAYDGMVLDLNELTKTEDVKPLEPKVTPKEPQYGLYLTEPHGQWIAQGKKTLIVKSKKFKAHIGEPLYLLEDHRCWGIIQLKEPREIDYEEFKKLRKEHLISDEEAFEKWGWDKKSPLYAYEFQLLERYDPPKIVKVPQGVQVFVSAKLLKWKELKDLSLLDLFLLHDYAHSRNLCKFHARIAREMERRNIKHSYRGICDRVYELLIKGWVEDYDPTKPNDRQLGDDWRIVLAWYTSLKKGKKLYKRVGDQKKPITLKDCRELALKIFKEMIKRGFTFDHPDTYKKYARELFVYCIKKIGGIEKVPWKEGKKPEKLQDTPTDIDPEKVTREQLEFIDDVYCKSLSDEDLKKLDKRLHELYKEIGKVTEPLENAHIFVWNEMRRRRIPHEIWDGLTEATALEVIEYPMPEYGKPQEIKSEEKYITLERALKAFPDFIVVEEDPIHVYLCGRIVNEKKIPWDHDIDILFKQSFPDVRIIHAFLEEVSKRDPEIAKRFHFVWDPWGPQIGLTVPLYRLAFKKLPEKEMKRKSPFEYLSEEKPKLFKPYVGLKPKSGFEKNEFWDVKEMWEKWAKKYIDEGIMIQKKYDGMRFQIHCDGDKIQIITEDRKRDRAKYFKKSVKELLKHKKADSFIIDAEMVEYFCGQNKTTNELEKYCEPVEREQMIDWIGATKKQLDDENVVFHIHDCVFINGEPINDKGYLERWEAIAKIIPPKLKHWRRVEGEVATSQAEFFRLCKKYRTMKGSEGVVAKAVNSTYKIKYKGENRTDEWCKLKNLKEIDVMVWEVHQKKTKEGKLLDQYLYDCVFEIPCKDKDKYRKRDLVEWKGKCYLKIGRTYATAEKCKKGDIIVVRPIRIAEFQDPQGKLYYTWMFPYFDGKHPAKKEPDTIDVVKKLVKIGTGPPPEQLSEFVIYLRECPFWKDPRICPLHMRFRIPRDHLSKIEDIHVKVQYLRFPIVCKFANTYRCRFVKSYYYGFKDFIITAEVDEDTGEILNVKSVKVKEEKEDEN